MKHFDFKEIVTLNVKVLNGFGYITPEFGSATDVLLFGVRSVIFIGPFLRLIDDRSRLELIFLGLIYIGMLTSEVVNLILVSEDMEKTINASFLALTHLVEICKVYAVIKHRDRLKQLLYNINRNQFQPKNLRQRKALGNYVHNSKVISMVFLAACVVTCAFWGVYPYVDDAKLQLPLPGWFPFDTNNSPWFEFAYVYQVIASTVNGLVNVSLDTFMSGKVSAYMNGFRQGIFM